MEDVSSGRNPLEIPEILENILECLPLKDLKSSRLVNKKWRDCGIAPMKKKAETEAAYSDKTIVDLAEFSECLNSVAGGSAKFPCSKFLLSLSLIRCDDGKKTRNKDEVVVSDFLQKISPLATELWLSMDLEKKLYMSTFPRKVDFPKLKLLEVSTIGLQFEKPKNSSKKLYRFVARVLEKAPSLKKIDLTDDQHSIDAIMKAKSSFTEMRIDGVKNTSMEKLSKWNREVKLKLLDLRFMYLKVDSTTFFQFLRSQNDSLETLVLYFHFSYVSSTDILSFPEMPKLKNLTIQLLHADYDVSRNRQTSVITFPVISYPRQFPALKALHFNPRNCIGVSLCKQFIKQDMPPVETLEELTLPTGDLSNEWVLTIQNAVRIFPNLKKLEIMGDSVLLPTVFENWANLEQLTLYATSSSSSCIDYMLMGHIRSGYERLEKRIKREGDDFDWNRLELGNATESIVNLQKLRVLRFINEDETSRELEVTRASLHLILSRIGSLRCVDFGDRGYPMETKIDKAWWAELNEDCVVLWNHIEYYN